MKETGSGEYWLGHTQGMAIGEDSGFNDAVSQARVAVREWAEELLEVRIPEEDFPHLIQVLSVVEEEFLRLREACE